MNIHGYHRLSRYIKMFTCLIIDSATVVPQQHKRCHGHASWSDIGYFVSYQLTSEFYDSLAIRKTRITVTTLCARLVSRDVTTRCATKCLIRCTISEMVAFMHTIQGEATHTHTVSVDQDAQSAATKDAATARTCSPVAAVMAEGARMPWSINLLQAPVWWHLAHTLILTVKYLHCIAYHLIVWRYCVSMVHGSPAVSTH